jgi:hypothetical protein
MLSDDSHFYGRPLMFALEFDSIRTLHLVYDDFIC